MKKKLIFALIGAVFLLTAGVGCRSIVGEIPSDTGDSGLKVIVKNESDNPQKSNVSQVGEQTNAGQNMISDRPVTSESVVKTEKSGAGEQIKKESTGTIKENRELKGIEKSSERDFVEEKNSMDGKDAGKSGSEHISTESGKSSEDLLNKEKGRQASAEAIQKILEKSFKNRIKYG